MSSPSIPWDHRPTTYLPPGSRWKETCRECDEFWPCFTFLEGIEDLKPSMVEDIMSETKPLMARFAGLVRVEAERRRREGPPDAGVLARL